LTVPISLQDAIDHLYTTVVQAGGRTSTSRLAKLAEFSVQELTTRGLTGVSTEQQVPGCGRAKDWDVAWTYDGKVRLAISLKSLLKNLAGTVPNRIDDLMGEAANAQLHSPEIVLGYVMIFDIGADRLSARHNSTWCELFRSRLTTLSGRCAPSWAIGTIEASVLLEVYFAKSSSIFAGADALGALFDCLVKQVRFRNPNALRAIPEAEISET
jgi:hypothetical protein